MIEAICKRNLSILSNTPSLVTKRLLDKLGTIPILVHLAMCTIWHQWPFDQLAKSGYKPTFRTYCVAQEGFAFFFGKKKKEKLKKKSFQKSLLFYLMSSKTHHVSLYSNLNTAKMTYLIPFIYKSHGSVLFQYSTLADSPRNKNIVYKLHGECNS